jgi:hypothetical protein
MATSSKTTGTTYTTVGTNILFPFFGQIDNAGQTLL